MSYSYNKLWKLLIDKGMLKKDLMAKTKITSSTMAKMGRGEAVSMDVLGRIIGNVIAYTFLVAVYGFIIYNVGKVILYLIRYAVYHIRRDINKYKSNKDKQ